MIKNNWLEENFTENEKHLYKIKEVIVDTKTKFQNASLLDIESYKKTLVLDGELQSTELDEFIYHESIVHPAMLTHNNPENILILGGGEGATLREVLKYKSVKKVVMIDIDGEVVDFCKNHLSVFHNGAFNDDRLELIIMDAKEYIENTKEKFDVIISDLCCPIQDSPAASLYTKKFYEKIKSKLNKNGILLIQSTPADIPQFKLFSSINNTLEQVFNFVYPFSSFIPSCIISWGYNLATDSDLKNPLNINDIDDLLNDRLFSNDLRYYDNITHKRMFCFPKHLRVLLEKENNVLTDDSLCFLFK
jgi:spermidine synthase